MGFYSVISEEQWREHGDGKINNIVGTYRYEENVMGGLTNDKNSTIYNLLVTPSSNRHT